MASKRQFGIFWGPEFLSIAETQRSQLIFSAVIPRQLEENIPEGSSKLTTSQENIQLTASMQRLVRDQNIIRPQVRLSVPTRDVIFRSFTLPAMNPAETENAVIFEAPRYTPFKLEDLFYTYHTVPFSDNGVKKNQILFLAIRQDKLNQYCKIIEDAQIEIASVEPSALGLLRILHLRKLITANETIAIVQVLGGQGAVMIVNQQAPYLIRDFNLIASGMEEGEKDFHSILQRLINEIRISFEFYTRQIKTIQDENKIKKIFIFANQNSREIAQGLQEDLGVESTSIEINEIFTYQTELHPSMANAIGASLAESVDLEFDLDLAKPRTSTRAPGESTTGFNNFFRQPPNYKTTTIIAGLCFLIIGAAFGIAQLQSFPQQKRLSELKNLDQKYQKMSLQDIRTANENIIKKIATYQKLCFQSYMATYLENISRSMFDGIWLINLEITYRDPVKNALVRDQKRNDSAETRIDFVIDGYSYDKDLNQQISLIEEFLKKLENNTFFKKHVKEITLKQVKKEELSDLPVTFFQIIMETDETNG